jgi:hypothetical protein
MHPAAVLVCLYIVFALFTGGISVAVLIGNRGSSTGSCCLPSSCNASLISSEYFRPPSGAGGVCEITASQAVQLGCPLAGEDSIVNCVVSNSSICDSLKGSSSVRTAGILGVCAPFSPVIGLLVGAAVLVMSASSGGGKSAGEFVVVIAVLVTLAMYISTTVFAGISYKELRTDSDNPYHMEPTQPCVASNATTGECTQWGAPAVVYASNSSQQVCPLAGKSAGVYGGKITGNVRTPIAMLYFFPLVFFGTCVLCVCVAVCAHKHAKSERMSEEEHHREVIHSSSDESLPRNNQSFVPKVTDAAEIKEHLLEKAIGVGGGVPMAAEPSL